jgi:hypothetical protein
MRESAIQKQIQLALGSRPDIRVFRNNVGFIKLGDRAIRYGLMPGSGDLIGWHTRTITAADVGTQVAVFLSVEVKNAAGRERPEQRLWRQAIQAAGGIAFTARSAEEALAAVERRIP